MTVSPSLPVDPGSSSPATPARQGMAALTLAAIGVVYGDIGNWSPTERETKHPSDIDPSLMQPLPFSGEAIPLPTACPAEH